MDNDVVSVLAALKTDVEAMRDLSRADDKEEFYLSGFSNSYLDEDGEPVISWPNLRYHLERINELLERKLSEDG